MQGMIALFDVGNTHTHIGLANSRRVLRQVMFAPPTRPAAGREAAEGFFRGVSLRGAAYCSVVPAVTPLVSSFAREKLGAVPLALTDRTVRGIGIDYPKPR